VIFLRLTAPRDDTNAAIWCMGKRGNLVQTAVGTSSDVSKASAVRSSVELVRFPGDRGGQGKAILQVPSGILHNRTGKDPSLRFHIPTSKGQLKATRGRISNTPIINGVEAFAQL
jgi:hypothetical protein